MTALLFLLLGLFLIFPACNIWLQVQAEKNMPYELTVVTTGDHIDLNTLLQVNGVQRVSPVIRLDAAISVEEYKLQCEVKAVYSSFLALKFTEGTLFPDNSNMPYLILNKAAAEAFFIDENKEMTIQANTEVILWINETERTAIICGIFDDDSKTPATYMSYDTAKREYSQSSGTELLLSLTDKGAGEGVVKAIQRLGLSASFDENESLRWELMKQQVWQLFMTSIGFIVCAVILILKNWQQELSAQKGELVSLLVFGMMEAEVKVIFPLRLIITEILCLIFATVMALAIGQFSINAVGTCFVLVFISFLIMSIRRR